MLTSLVLAAQIVGRGEIPQCQAVDGKAALLVSVATQLSPHDAIPGVDLGFLAAGVKLSGEGIPGYTDGEGHACALLPAGRYVVRASLAGFIPAEVANVAAIEGKVVEVTMHLRLTEPTEVIILDDNDHNCRYDSADPFMYVMPSECIAKLPF